MRRERKAIWHNQQLHFASVCFTIKSQQIKGCPKLRKGITDNLLNTYILMIGVKSLECLDSAC